MIDDTQMKKIESKLADMAKNAPEVKRPNTGKALFEKYQTQILELTGMGYSAEQIRNSLASVGVKMTVSTVKQYIRDISRPGGKEKPTSGIPG